MSHFTVLVIGPKNENELEEALAPFFEQVDDDSPYAVFDDKTDEVLAEFEEEQEFMRHIGTIGTGKLSFAWKDECYRPATPEEAKAIEKDKTVPHKREWDGFNKKDKYLVPDTKSWVACISTFKEYYGTLERFVEEYHGYEGTLDIDGEQRYGYYHNPNAKWDWWSLGGRWSGMLKVKEGASSGTIGEGGAFGRRNTEENFVDMCRIGDLDIEGMQKKEIEDRLPSFHTVYGIVKEYGMPKRWDDIRNSVSDIEEARKIYHDQPAITAITTTDSRLMPWGKDLIDRYCLDRPDPEKAFIELCRCEAFSTFAVLKDGVWYERGEMGWWGVAMNEKNPYDWETKFMELIEELHEDTVISVVDCHI